jgi:hydrogenase-4 membrane subunit HyfE
MIELALLITGAIVIVSGRTITALGAYVVLAATVSALVAPSASASWMTLALFLLATAIKVVLVPAGIVLFLRANPAAGDLRPSLVLPLRLLLVVGFAILAYSAGHFPTLVAIQFGSVAGFVLLSGVGMLIVHRNLISHMIGLLTLGVAISLAGAIFAPELPESFELGATFDALVATFIGLALVRSIVAHNPLLDVESLRSLRG